MIVTITASRPQFGDKKSFQQVMLEGIHTVTDRLVNDLKTNDPYSSIGPYYYQQDLVNGTSVQVSIGNKSQIWPFREYDTKPHWPPWGPGTNLDNWAKAKGVPTFLAARKISREGTTGNHLFANTWNRQVGDIRGAIQNASYAYVLGKMGVAA